MILPDVNVLVYAYRPESEYHSVSHNWLQSVLNGAAAYGMSAQVLSSFVRIVTHPRVFSKPNRLPGALRYCNTLLDQPHCQWISPGPRHWPIFQELCRSAAVTGNLVSDAWFAALAIESGCEWITFDRDYARFNGLRWRVPG